MRALTIAATGMSAQQLNVEVIANNIANINTTSFKRQRAEFADLLYQVDRSPGTPGSGATDVVPEGTRIGLGVRAVAVRNLHTAGALTQTGNNLDLAIVGRGFFRISGADGETLYTRSGAFNKSAGGQIVTADGHQVLPAVTVPADALSIQINDSGQVYAQISGEAELRLLGQVTTATFVNEAGLMPIGNNLFRESQASGAATVAAPGASGAGAIKQGYLEASNVDAVKEITELISAQRAYEMNSKIIQASDDMLSVITKGLR